MVVLSCVWLFPTLWTTGHQAPLSMRFSRQEYWSVLSFLLPGDLSNPGIKLASIASPALAGVYHWLFTTVPLGKPHLTYVWNYIKLRLNSTRKAIFAAWLSCLLEENLMMHPHHVCKPSWGLWEKHINYARVNLSFQLDLSLYLIHFSS